MDDVLEMPENLAVSTCAQKAPTMSSHGIWEANWRDILRHPMPLLELQLCVVFFLHYLLHFLHKRFKLPWLVIHGLVGMIIGHVLRRSKHLSAMVLHDEAEYVITTLISSGFTLFVFLIGVKMDPSMIKKSGRPAWTMGILCLVFSTVFSLPFFIFINAAYADKAIELEFFFFVQSLTPFPVIACLLTDLKILNSELGRLASSATLISFLLSNFLMILFIYVNLFRQISALVAIKGFLVAAAFVLSMTIVMRPMMLWIIKRTPEGKPVRESYIVMLIALSIMTSVIGDFVGLEYMSGPFALGLIIPDGPPLGSTLVERLDTIVSGVVVPLFMTYGGYFSIV